MSNIEDDEWIWQGHYQISPTGSTGITEFPSRLTHSYFVDLAPNSTWTFQSKILSIQSKHFGRVLFAILVAHVLLNVLIIGYQIKKVMKMDKNDTRIIRRWITLNSATGDIIIKYL